MKTAYNHVLAPKTSQQIWCFFAFTQFVYFLCVWIRGGQKRKFAYRFVSIFAIIVCFCRLPVEKYKHLFWRLYIFFSCPSCLTMYYHVLPTYWIKQIDGVKSKFLASLNQWIISQVLLTLPHFVHHLLDFLPISVFSFQVNTVSDSLPALFCFTFHLSASSLPLLWRAHASNCRNLSLRFQIVGPLPIVHSITFADYFAWH